LIDSSSGELERFAYAIGSDLGEVDEDLAGGHALRNHAEQGGNRMRVPRMHGTPAMI
jgi:hypothetical protein